MRIGTALAERYQITAELGRGGMGVVYLAHDPRLDREVAVKVLGSASIPAVAEERFLREARLVAQMDHPSIVPIYDIGRHEELLFFVMPVMRGTTLVNKIRDGSLSLGEILEIGAQVAEALDYSHQRGVIHRDIKPENIMVGREEEHLRARVMDFGLALGRTVDRVTRTGALPGTPTYLSPEQILTTEVDGRSDLYSLATILYECLTGKPPFTGSRYTLLYRIVHEEPPVPAIPGMGPQLSDLLMRCLAKDPVERLQRGNDLALQLRHCAADLPAEERERSPVSVEIEERHDQRPGILPLIGHRAELGELQRHLEEAATGECHCVLVGGDAGLGKTRLLQELESLAEARRIRVLQGRFYEHESSFPYQGFMELIQDEVRRHEAAGEPAPGDNLRDLATELVALFPPLGEIPALRTASRSAAEPPARRRDPRVPQRVRGRNPRAPEGADTSELLARALGRLGGGKPTVFLLEHLHGSETAVEVLQYVVRRLGPTPTLFVGTYRPGEVHRRHSLTRLIKSFRGDPRCDNLVLTPLDAREHVELLSVLVGSDRLTPELVARLYEATEGNPFFTQELVRALLDSGEVVRDETGSWTLSEEAAITVDALPETIQQAVQARLERLPDELREVIAAASVLGRNFDFEDLQALLDKPDLDAAVEDLIRDGFLDEGHQTHGDWLCFRSGVVCDVLYADLSRRRRRMLHRRHAEHLEARWNDRLERVYPQLVHHFAAADQADKTIAYALTLARCSHDLFGAEAAIRATRTALQLVDEDDPRNGELRRLTATALRTCGQVEPGLREAAKAVQILESHGRLAAAAQAALTAAELAWQLRKVGQTRRWCERGIQLAHGVGVRSDSGADDPGTVQLRETLRKLLMLRATLANLRGEYDKAHQCREEAEELRPAFEKKTADLPVGGTLVTALATPVTALDPGLWENAEAAEVLGNVFETLVRPDADGNLVPWLCTGWEGRSGSTVFRFALRPEVRFSDGTPLRALDVTRSLEESTRREDIFVAPGCMVIRGAHELREGRSNDLAGLRILDDSTVEIHLVEPLPFFPAMLTELRTAVRRLAHGGRWVLGTGPFRIALHDRRRVVLARNVNYWRGEPPRLDRIEFRTEVQASQIAASLRAGELDLARDLLPEDLDEILHHPRLRSGLVDVSQKNIYFVFLNARGPRTRNPLLRQALVRTIRSRDLVWRTLGRFVEPATGLIPPGVLGHNPAPRRETMTLGEASQMLSEAGIDKRPIELTAAIHPLFIERYRTLLDALLAEWAEIGISVEIEPSTMESYVARWNGDEEIDLLFGRWMLDFDDPDNVLFTPFHSVHGHFGRGLSSAAADPLLEKARREARTAARLALYRKAEAALAEQDVVLPLFHDIDYRSASPRIRNLRVLNTLPFVNYAEIAKLPEEREATLPVSDLSSGTVHVALPARFDSLEPALAFFSEPAEVVPTVFETLTRVDEGARIVPNLAAEFRAEKGSQSFRFRLRPQVRFHDGRKLTVRDVRYTFELLLRTPRTGAEAALLPILGALAFRRGEASEIAGLEIVSDHELVIELERPLSFYPAMLTHPATAIIPDGTSNFTGSWRDGCAGTGPFRVIRFEPGERIELEANPNYRRQGFPKCRRLVFDLGIGSEQELEDFKSGRLSIASHLRPADLETLRREPEIATRYLESPGFSTYYLVFNTRYGALAAHDVRRAFVRCFDIGQLARETLGRIATPARSLVPPGLLGYESRRRPPRPASDDELALLRGLELVVSAHPAYVGVYARFWKRLCEELDERGVRLRVSERSTGERVSIDVSDRWSSDLVASRWFADFPDSASFYDRFRSEEGLDGAICGTPEIDDLIFRGRTEPDAVLRHTLYRQLEEALEREAIVVPLFHEQTYRFYRPGIEGLRIQLGYPQVAYEEICWRGD